MYQCRVEYTSTRTVVSECQQDVGKIGGVLATLFVFSFVICLSVSHDT